MNITAYYTCVSTWDMEEILEDLDITIEQVKEYYIKWNTLHLTYIDADGNEVEEEISATIDGVEDGGFCKHPTDTDDEFESHMKQTV